MPTENFVQLPDDTFNVGKQVRTHTRVVGGVTVHNHTQELQDPVDDVQARVLTRDATVGDAGLTTRSVSDNYNAQMLALAQQEYVSNYEDRFGFRSGRADGPRQGFRS
jgi:hypothetical protein